MPGFFICLSVMQTVNAMGGRARNSHRSIVKVLDFLATVLLQDALELAAKYPRNPVLAFLMQNEQFRYSLVLALYFSSSFQLE